jgi:RNA polymerase sigma factor (TIGR02999 family)
MAAESNSLLTNQILTELYTELRRLAGHYLKYQNRTLQPTALVHEAFLRISSSGPWRDRSHFLGTAALAMRQVLAHEQDRRTALKRQAIIIDIEAANVSEAPRSFEFAQLEQAFSRLEAHSPEACRVAELRFIGGLTVEETAVFLDTSPRTVKRLWSFARAILARELGALE